jgi:hypothetical protein
MSYRFAWIDDEDDSELSHWILPLPVTVGRCPTADITIGDRSISRRHCQFLADSGGALLVRDLGSMNGVYIDDRRVDKALVPPSGIVRIGAVCLHVEWTEDRPVESAAVDEVYDVNVDATQPMKAIRPDAEAENRGG